MDGLLAAHLREWLGRWPPDAPVQVVGAAVRAAPGWDGRYHPVVGVSDPEAGTLLSVPVGQQSAIAHLVDGALDLERLSAPIAAAVGRPEARLHRGVFRWSTAPAQLPEVGVWERAAEPGMPQWLRPFGGEALVTRDRDGRYLAGVGLKRHGERGWEIAVGTEPAARGAGLARRLVAQAARRVLAEGRIPTYQHDPANLASARVADAAGFPDRGWTSLGLFGP